SDLYAGNLFIRLETVNAPNGEIEGSLLLATAPITIDGDTFSAEQFRTFRLEGVRSVSMRDMFLNDMALVDSSVNWYNCRSDNRYAFINTNNWPYRVDLNEASSLTAHELRYGSQVSEAIFVNSIS